MDLAFRQPKVLNTDSVDQNNNDHVLSFDGKMLGISSSSGEEAYGSLIYTVPAKGGVPKRITPLGPSYLHGWSPDGRHITFQNTRTGTKQIYIMNADGKNLKMITAYGANESPSWVRFKPSSASAP